MTELALSDLYPALEAIEKKHYIVDNRSMLGGSLIRDGKTLATHAALNEVVVSKSAIARLNHFELFVNAEFVIQLPGRCADHRHADRFYRVFAGSGEGRF